MANSVNKVVYDGRTLIDLTSDTVVAGAMRQNYTAPPKNTAASCQNSAPPLSSPSPPISGHSPRSNRTSVWQSGE